ncbi:MAG: hypothetical protein LBL46_00800 [Rickettsiales bacterium]|nr:hypothetical protein [Rickettsiales bacterium]
MSRIILCATGLTRDVRSPAFGGLRVSSFSLTRIPLLWKDGAYHEF